jgi:hypothetical protein
MAGKRWGWAKRKAAGFKLKNTSWNKGNKGHDTSQPTSRSETAPTTSTKSLKRFTHQEFTKTFQHADGKFLPIAEGIVSSSTEHSPGGVLHPHRWVVWSWDNSGSKERGGELSGCYEVHLPTVIDGLQDCIAEHSDTRPECKGRLATAADLLDQWGVSAAIRLKCTKCPMFPERKKCIVKSLVQVEDEDVPNQITV